MRELNQRTCSESMTQTTISYQTILDATVVSSIEFDLLLPQASIQGRETIQAEQACTTSGYGFAVYDQKS